MPIASAFQNWQFMQSHEWTLLINKLYLKGCSPVAHDTAYIERYAARSQCDDGLAIIVNLLIGK